MRLFPWLVVLTIVPAGLAHAATPKPLPSGVEKGNVEEELRRARVLYDELEYDKVILLTKAILARDDVGIDQRLDAYLLQGECMAVVGDPIDAEQPFRLLLRARPDFDMPGTTPPKILAVFRKVQAEERVIREETRKAKRKKIVSGMEILGEDPEEIEGGLPLLFSYRVRDPNSTVVGARVQYKRSEDEAYSSLALTRDDEGAWRGAIPGEWTANDDGFTLNYVVETFDEEGILVRRGTSAEPVAVTVTPGTAERSAPPPLPLWSFLGVSGGAVLVVATAGVFTGLTALAQADYNFYLQQSVNGAAADPAEVQRRATIGQTLMWTQFGLYGLSAAIALGAAVMTPFVNWTGEEAVEY